MARLVCVLTRVCVIMSIGWCQISVRGWRASFFVVGQHAEDGDRGRRRDPVQAGSVSWEVGETVAQPVTRSATCRGRVRSSIGSRLIGWRVR